MSGRLVTCACGLRVMRAGYSKHERACRGVKPTPIVEPVFPCLVGVDAADLVRERIRGLHAIGAVP